METFSATQLSYISSSWYNQRLSRAADQLIDQSQGCGAWLHKDRSHSHATGAHRMRSGSAAGQVPIMTPLACLFSLCHAPNIIPHGVAFTFLVPAARSMPCTCHKSLLNALSFCSPQNHPTPVHRTRFPTHHNVHFHFLFVSSLLLYILQQLPDLTCSSGTRGQQPAGCRASAMCLYCLP